MKYRYSLIILSTIFLCMLSFKTYAKKLRYYPRGMGVGISLGDPTGLSVKHFHTRRKAVDFALGYNLDSNLHIHSDYVYHFFSFIPSRKRSLKFISGFISGGGKLYFIKSDDALKMRFGLRFGGGLIYYFPDIPLESYLEIVPTMNLVSETGLEIDAAAGVRYYFPL